MQPEVLTRTDPGGLVRITINRPDKHNPLSLDVLEAIARTLTAVAGEDEVRCAVIRGAGERYFAAGGDLRRLAEVRTAEATAATMEASRAALDVVRAFPLPVVALLNGDALGGGAELAVACDMRIIRAGARIGFIQGRLNICSAWGGGPDLYSLLGRARALRMGTRAELIDAPTALSWGLVDDICPDDALEAALDAFVAPILRQTPLVLRAWKRQANAVRSTQSYGECRAIERDMIVRTWTHDDHWQAVAHVLSPSRETQ